MCGRVGKAWFNDDTWIHLNCKRDNTAWSWNVKNDNTRLGYPMNNNGYLFIYHRSFWEPVIKN